MTIQDLGSIGELVAALATVATLGYLAVQVRLNTRALKASTFQSISSEMSQNVSPMLLAPEIPVTFGKMLEDPESLDASERLRMQAFFLISFRRLEAAFVHAELGSITREFLTGFDLSIVSVANSSFGREWWSSARAMFYPPFVEHVDALLAGGTLPDANPAFERHT